MYRHESQLLDDHTRVGVGPLRPFGLRSVNVTTLQAISGAGYPGVASLDILGNVIPYIGGEEEKSRQRPGRFSEISSTVTSCRTL